MGYYLRCCCCCKFHFFGGKEPKTKPAFLIIGLNDAGKTTLLHRLMNDKVEVPTPTWGFTSETVKINKNEITIYDVSGSPTIRGIWKNYYAEIYGIIFVVDVSNEKSITKSKEIIPEVLEDNRLKGKPILIVANKVDKIESFEYIDIYNKLNIEQVVLDGLTPIDNILVYPSTCLLVKGKRDLRIDSCIEWLLQKVKENRNYINEKIKEDIETQEEYLLEQKESKKRLERNIKSKKLQDEQKQLEQRFISNITDSVDEIEDSVNSDQIEDSVNSDQIEDSINSDQIEESINYDQIDDSVNDQIEDSVNSDQIEDSVNDQIEDSVNDQIEDSVNYDQIEDSVNSDQIELLTKEQWSYSKSHSSKSLKIYPEEDSTSN